MRVDVAVEVKLGAIVCVGVNAKAGFFTAFFFMTTFFVTFFFAGFDFFEVVAILSP